MMLESLPPFDPGFASPSEWAAMYRACGIQVVPAPYPMRTAADKRPNLAGWKEFHDELVADDLFAKWFPPTAKPNMGAIAGNASGRLLVIDLDEYKPNVGAMASAWWRDVTGGVDPETWQQRTGGGGRQIFFRLPPGLSIGNASAHALGVDIRCQAGFALMPPTMHMSGTAYRWLDGFEPWNIELDTASPEIIDAVIELIEQHGGGVMSGGERTPSPQSVKDAFGNDIDGREVKMRNMVWARVVDLRRDSPIMPDNAALHDEFVDLYTAYARTTKTRLADYQNANAAGLEREGRGLTAFRVYWNRALKKWEKDISREAEKPRPLEESYRGKQFDARAYDSGRNGAAVDGAGVGVIGPQPALILSAKEFVAGFTPPAYLIDGILQRGYLYSCTARTGHGKTAVSMFLAQCVARGQAVKGKGVKQGAVLILAGENPDDVRARFLVLAEAMGFDPADVPIHFIAGVINIEESLPRIQAEAENIENLLLVIVDTAAAYFRGDDTNSNAQAGNYARVLRQLTFLPGKPAVFVNSHPVKNASRDNLLPVGGGAFLNEVDGNLTLWSEGERETTLHWQGKFRGPEFEPIAFKLDIATSERVADEDGELLPSVVARTMSEVELLEGQDERSRDMRVLLSIMAGPYPPLPQSEMARKASWLTADGKPHKSKVNRLLQKMKDHKLVKPTPDDKWAITSEGKRFIGIKDD